MSEYFLPPELADSAKLFPDGITAKIKEARRKAAQDEENALNSLLPDNLKHSEDGKAIQAWIQEHGIYKTEEFGGTCLNKDGNDGSARINYTSRIYYPEYLKRNLTD